jgi:hypothetical protein
VLLELVWEKALVKMWVQVLVVALEPFNNMTAMSANNFIHTGTHAKIPIN